MMRGFFVGWYWGRGFDDSSSMRMKPLRRAKAAAYLGMSVDEFDSRSAQIPSVLLGKRRAWFTHHLDAWLDALDATARPHGEAPVLAPQRKRRKVVSTVHDWLAV